MSDKQSRKESVIRHLYEELKWSQSKIAEHLDMSQSGIGKILKRLGIQSRNCVNLGKQNGRYKDGKQSRIYRTLIIKEKCENCGSVNDLCVHHINYDHFDNRLENLQVLCMGCHSSQHKKRWWAKRKALNESRNIRGIPAIKDVRIFKPRCMQCKNKYQPLYNSGVITEKIWERIVFIKNVGKEFILKCLECGRTYKSESQAALRLSEKNG